MPLSFVTILNDRFSVLDLIKMTYNLFCNKDDVKLAKNRFRRRDGQERWPSIELSFFFLEKGLKIEILSGGNGGRWGGSNPEDMVIRESSSEIFLSPGR